MTGLIPDLDIYRAANILVKQHGEDAPIQAALRADVMNEDIRRAEVRNWIDLLVLPNMNR